MKLRCSGEDSFPEQNVNSQSTMQSRMESRSQLWGAALLTTLRAKGTPYSDTPGGAKAA